LFSHLSLATSPFSLFESPFAHLLGSFATSAPIRLVFTSASFTILAACTAFSIAARGHDFSIVATTASTTRSFGGFVLDFSDVHCIFHLLLVLLSSLGKFFFPLFPPFLHLFLHFRLHPPQLFPLFLLLLPHATLFFVNFTRARDMILRLRQQILTLTSLNGRPCQIVFHPVALYRQVLEILVGQSQFVNGLQDFIESGLFITEELAG